MDKVRAQQNKWGTRADRWHRQVHASSEQGQLREALLEQARASAGEKVVDLGAGTGFLALALAPHVADVLCVDVTEEMLDRLRAEADRRGLGNVRLRLGDLAAFDLPARSVDLVVSNLALHHLTRRDKQDLLVRARRWLRPGGRIVIGDEMYGRGGSVRDWALILDELRYRSRRGIRALLGLVRDATKVALGIGTEMPAPPDFWVRAMARAGFADARCVRTLRTAGVVAASAEPGPSTAAPPAGGPADTAPSLDPR